MPYFSPELSCTDGSTDAFNFPPSVHPTLYKSVGRVCHNGLAQLKSSLTLTSATAVPRRSAAFVLASDDFSTTCTCSHIRRSSAVPSCSPPATRAAPSRRFVHVRRTPPLPWVWLCRRFRPAPPPGAHRRPSRGAQAHQFHP
jgi:hypothetical protein